jgi:hypothetical protein
MLSRVEHGQTDSPDNTLQHVLSKSLYCITPHINPSPDDWESWIQEESIRR